MRRANQLFFLFAVFVSFAANSFALAQSSNASPTGQENGQGTPPDKPKPAKPPGPPVLSPTNSQSQGQGQDQTQSQTQTARSVSRSDNANNAALSVSVAGDTANYQAPARNPVATAYAPAYLPTAVCALGMSGGAQGATFGFSLGGSYIDKNCEVLEQVRRAAELGFRDVAAEMMMDLPAFAGAAQRVNQRSNPASLNPLTHQVAPPVPTAEQYTDPIIRARLGLPPLHVLNQ